MDHDQRFKTLIKVFFRDFLLLFFQEWALRLMRFEYLYVGLSALDGVEYVRKDNWLAVALSALTKIPPNQVAWLGAEAFQRIQAAPLTDQQRFLLFTERAKLMSKTLV